jgi:glycosyltransferase involved in cell wall biosynthesis
MKLIIQIPCLNEAETLPITLKSLPKKIEGVDEIEILVIDDGSSDETKKVAKEWGIKNILCFQRRVGLARAFKAGLEESLRLGADIIVNTDADNQYDGTCIEDLIKPILNKKADIVIGDRQIQKTNHQGVIKGFLQFLGSRIVSKLSGLNIKDVTSGFRAFSKKAAFELNIVSDFSYTLESIIQAGEKGLMVTNVVIKTNPSLRESRLFKNNFHYIQRSVATILKVYVAYEGFRVFVTTGSILIFIGIILIGRYSYFFLANQNPAGHIQSLIIASILIIVGFLVLMLGLLTDLVSSTRRLAEESLSKLKKITNLK